MGVSMHPIVLVRLAGNRKWHIVTCTGDAGMPDAAWCGLCLTGKQTLVRENEEVIDKFTICARCRKQADHVMHLAFPETNGLSQIMSSEVQAYSLR